MTGNELRAQRTQLGLTQQDLANVLGVTVTTVARWERNEVPIVRHQMIQAILDAMLRDQDGITRPSEPTTIPHPSHDDLSDTQTVYRVQRVTYLPMLDEWVREPIWLGDTPESEVAEFATLKHAVRFADEFSRRNGVQTFVVAYPMTHGYAPGSPVVYETAGLEAHEK